MLQLTFSMTSTYLYIASNLSDNHNGLQFLHVAIALDDITWEQLQQRDAAFANDRKQRTRKLAKISINSPGHTQALFTQTLRPTLDFCHQFCDAIDPIMDVKVLEYNTRNSPHQSVVSHFRVSNNCTHPDGIPPIVVTNTSANLSILFMLVVLFQLENNGHQKPSYSSYTVRFNLRTAMRKPRPLLTSMNHSCLQSVLVTFRLCVTLNPQGRPR